jgi:hypothetical protein
VRQQERISNRTSRQEEDVALGRGFLGWMWVRRRLRVGRIQAASGAPDPVASEVWALLRYLDQLEEWSHRVWSGAGPRRPWLPDVVEGQLRGQWWTEATVPSREILRGRIATFWARVVPWLAWNPGCEGLPDPPPDRPLIGAIVRRLEDEVARSGRHSFGRERNAALERTVRRLQLIDSIGAGRAGRTA